MARTQGVWAVRLVTKQSLVSLHADALAVLTVAVSRTVRDLALLIANVALLPFPSRLTETLAVDVITLARTEQRTNTLTAVLAIKSWMTLALAQQAVSVTVAPVGTSFRQLLRVPWN